MAEFFRWLFDAQFLRLSLHVLMAAMLIFGADLILGSKLMHWLGRTLNKCLHVDHLVISLLEKLKKASDVEYHTDSMLLHGMGRLVCGGILFLAVFLMYTQLLPRVK